MKFRTAAAPLLIIVCLVFATLFLPTPSAFAAPSDPTVHLPTTPIATFSFSKITGDYNVAVSVTNLDERLSYKDFEKYVILTTNTGKPVEFRYTTLLESAIINFTLSTESIFLTLDKKLLDALPGATLNAPVIETDVPVVVDQKSYRAVTAKVQSGEINLHVSSVAETPEILADIETVFKDYTVLNALNFKSKIERTTLGGVIEEVFFPTGESLKLRVELPDYRENYKYAFIIDFGAEGVYHEPLKPVVIGGFAYADVAVSRNGNFSIVAYSETMMPWWAILLITGGGAAIVGGALLAVFLMKRKNAKNGKNKVQESKKDSSESETQQNTKSPSDKDHDGANGKTKDDGAEKPPIPKGASAALPFDAANKGGGTTSGNVENNGKKTKDTPKQPAQKNGKSQTATKTGAAGNGGSKGNNRRK